MGAKSTGRHQSFREEKIDESVLNEEAVVLLNGTNAFGDPIFSYTKFTLRNFRRMSDDMRAGKDLRPSDYGEVVAAGRGEPSQELRDEMAVKYKMVNVPQRAAAPNMPAQRPLNTHQPKFFGDED